MPRRTVNRCARRADGQAIDETTELLLTHGHCFGVAAWEQPLQARSELARLWNRWGDLLTARWIQAYPGSRPMALYLLGELPAPTWRHELPALRHPVRVGGELAIADRAWHGRRVELEHLDELGILADDERELAITRVDGPDPRAPRLYRETLTDR